MCGVALGEGEDSFEAIPEVPAGSTMGDQAWDAEVPELPQATCLVEVLKECERAVAGEEIYQVAGDGGHAVKDASAWVAKGSSEEAGSPEVRLLPSAVLSPTALLMLVAT